MPPAQHLHQQHNSRASNTTNNTNMDSHRRRCSNRSKLRPAGFVYTTLCTTSLLLSGMTPGIRGIEGGKTIIPEAATDHSSRPTGAPRQRRQQTRTHARNNARENSPVQSPSLSSSMQSSVQFQSEKFPLDDASTNSARSFSGLQRNRKSADEFKERQTQKQQHSHREQRQQNINDKKNQRMQIQMRKRQLRSRENLVNDPLTQPLQSNDGNKVTPDFESVVKVNYPIQTTFKKKSASTLQQMNFENDVMPSNGYDSNNNNEKSRSNQNNNNENNKRQLQQQQQQQKSQSTSQHQIVTKTYFTTPTCNPQTHQPFLFHFQTDAYGSETSWYLKETDDITSNSIGNYLGFGPPSGYEYGDLTIYSYSYCLEIGKSYQLAMEDNFGDGMCCERGFGGYEFLIGGVRVYSSDYRETFSDFVEHEFVVQGGEYTAQPSRSPTLPPTEKPTFAPIVGGGGGGSGPACEDSDPQSCGCAEVNMIDYRGNVSITETGLECMDWRAQYPHEHPYFPESFPEAGLESNYCRNPNGGPGGIDSRPWCFTMNSEKRWEYCNVNVCGGTRAPTTSPVVSPTLSPIMPTTNPSASPSSFPSYPPTNAPTARPTNKPTNNYSVLNPSNGCYGGDVHVRVEVKADEFSTDTSWEIFAPNGTKVLHEVAGSFGMYEVRSKEICLPHGVYNFSIYDVYGDGICCRYGEGYYQILLDGFEVLHGGSFNEKESVQLNIGFDPTGYMSEREVQYLEAHNYRRKEWHERYNLTYVPLRYSPELARESKDWAEELLNACGIVGIEHESNNPYGENLAKNTGNGGWGQLYPPENIVGRWVDFEIGLPYPSNGHLTQALWRASKYIGCGESVKEFRGGFCRVQVCRYGRAGNCDMARFNATSGENWLPPMLEHYSRCGPNCPPEGCF